MSCVLAQWVLFKQAHSARTEVETLPSSWHSVRWWVSRRLLCSPAVCRTVCREHSWLYGTQLCTWHTAVCRLSQCSHGTVWHTAGPGTCLSGCSALQGAVISRCTAISGHSCLWGAQLAQETQLSAERTAAELQ